MYDEYYNVIFIWCIKRKHCWNATLLFSLATPSTATVIAWIDAHQCPSNGWHDKIFINDALLD